MLEPPRRDRDPVPFWRTELSITSGGELVMSRRDGDDRRPRLRVIEGGAQEDSLDALIENAAVALEALAFRLPPTDQLRSILMLLLTHLRTRAR